MRTPISQQELTRKILDESIQVVSFDIFDTLIYRPVTKPSDLFYLIKEDVQKILKDPSINFEVIRTLADVKVRELNPDLEDITIHEIYEYFVTDLSILPDDAQQIKELEIALELKYAQPRKKMLEIFELAKRANKTIVLTSDMYLTDKEVLPILSKCGYEGFDKIFISSQCRKLKASGNLYGEILENLNIVPNQMLHIGDNWHSDIEMAEKSGVHCFYIPKIIDSFKQSRHGEYWDSYTDYITSYSMKFLTGLCSAKLFDNPFGKGCQVNFYSSNTYNFAYVSLGPLFFSLVLWLLQDMEQSSHDKIFFLSRDGYLPKLIYDKLSPYFLGAPPSDYLYTSRSALKSAYLRYPWGILKSLEDNPYSLELRNLRGILLTRFGLQLSNAEYRDIKSQISDKQNVPPSLFANILADYKSKISKNAESEFSMAKRYYTSHFNKSDSPAVFDIGHLGGAIEGLCAFLDSYHLPFYYMIGAYYRRENLFLCGKLFDHHAHDYHKYCSVAMPLLEKITQSDEGSCIGFKDEEGTIQPVLLNEVDNLDDTRKRQEIQKGILDFCDDCVNTFGSDILKLKIENHLFLRNLLHVIVNTTDGEISELLGSLFYSDSFGGDHSTRISEQILVRRSSFLATNEFLTADKSLNQDQWYRFGQLSRKRKLWELSKMLSKQLNLYKILLPSARVFKTLYFRYNNRRR